MKTGATFSVVVQVFLFYQVTTEVIDINFLQYHFYPVHQHDKCVATHKCTSNSPQQGFHCCPRLEVIQLPGDGGCTKHFCTDTCTQCGRGTPPTRCTSRPQYHTMNIDFTGDDSSHMAFDVNMTAPNIFLIMACDCYEMSTERDPMFHKCLRLNTSDPFKEIHSVPNQYGYFNVTLNMSLHVQDLPKRPLMESSSVPTTNGVKEWDSTTNGRVPSSTATTLYPSASEILPVTQRQEKESDIHVNITGLTVTCIAGGLAVTVPFVTLLLVNKISK